MMFLKKRKKEILVSIILVSFMAIACLIFYQPMMDLFKEPQSIRLQLQNFGILGYFILAMIMAFQVIFVFLPGEIIEIMAGFIYGPIGGMIACLLGSAIGSALIYYFVKKLGKPFIDKFIGLDKMKQIHFLDDPEKRNILLFIVFFIPGTPKDILTYFVPLTDMKFSTFLFITTIARIPSIITSTIGGHAIGVENYLFSIIVFVITGLISLGGIYIYKKLNEKKTIEYHL
ncbi:TVP38/TMEM64 family protein [Candidatus Stoquefichus massiliensis]|uniref:TVP38/TMEM64 family protein n=1 Tax=Candidatus Stoquefichus massiliensis TaxID=1470350 RepID=UPI0004832C76|nr:VTT domain-containing protein [Candidatus Stoquefichus massiliensis]